MKNKYLMADGADGGGGEAAAPVAAAPVVASGSSSAAAWHDSITDQETKAAVIKMFPGMKSYEDLAKTAVNQQRELGKPKVTLPTKPEERLAFLQSHFAAPKEGKGYKLDAIKMPEGLKPDEKALAPFMDTFAKAGLTQEQADSVLGFYHAQVGEQVKTSAEARKNTALASRQTLEKEWGQDFTAKFVRADQALNTLGGEGFVQKCQELGLTDDVQFVKFLANVGELMREDRATGGLAPSGFATGPKQAAYDINAKMADPKFVEAYSNPQHPGYNNARTEMTRLFKIKHGEKVD